MKVNRTSILVIMVTGALIGSMATMSLQQAFGVNRQTLNIRLDSSACQPGSSCNNSASQNVNFVGTSDNNFATEDIDSKNACDVGSTCSNDASQFLVINDDGNGATLITNQRNECYIGSICSNDSDFSVGISGNNNLMVGHFVQFNGCRVSSTCTNTASFINDLPPGNSGSFEKRVASLNNCSTSSDCTNDVNNIPGGGFLKNNCHLGSTCSNSGGTGTNLNQCSNGAICTNSGQTTNVQAEGAVSCSSGAPGTTTTCLPGQPPIVRP